jgi:hypothetical protein
MAKCHNLIVERYSLKGKEAANQTQEIREILEGFKQTRLTYNHKEKEPSP